MATGECCPSETKEGGYGNHKGTNAKRSLSVPKKGKSIPGTTEKLEWKPKKKKKKTRGGCSCCAIRPKRRAKTKAGRRHMDEGVILWWEYYPKEGKRKGNSCQQEKKTRIRSKMTWGGRERTPHIKREYG